MLRQIVIEVETLGDSRTTFSLRIDANVVFEDITTDQARVLVGTILERIALPRPVESRNSRGSASPSSTCEMWALKRPPGRGG
jgi:hypothetical protein